MTGDCKHCDALLMEYAYDELDDASTKQLKAHLDDCADCTAALDEIRITRRMVAQAPEVPPFESPEMTRDLMEMAANAADEFKLCDEEDVFSRERVPRSAGRIDPAPSFLDTLRAWLLKPAMATAVAGSTALVLAVYLGKNTDNSG